MEVSSWLCSTVSWKFKIFEVNISIWSHLNTFSSFSNGHSEVCTSRQNHLSFGNLRSTRRVTLVKTNLAAAYTISSRETISSTPQSSIRRSSNCMRNLATDAGNKLFKLTFQSTYDRPKTYWTLVMNNWLISQVY